MSKKNYSYRERKNYHTDRMRQGLGHGGKMNIKESYSTGFVHWMSDMKTYNDVKSHCDKVAFEKGERAGSKAYNKAMDYKF